MMFCIFVEFVLLKLLKPKTTLRLLVHYCIWTDLCTYIIPIVFNTVFHWKENINLRIEMSSLLLAWILAWTTCREKDQLLCGYLITQSM